MILNQQQLQQQQLQQQQLQQQQLQQNPVRRFLSLTRRASKMKPTRSVATELTAGVSISSLGCDEEEIEEEELEEQESCDWALQDIPNHLSSKQDFVRQMKEGAFQQALETLELTLQVTSQHSMTNLDRTCLFYHRMMVHLELSRENDDQHDMKATSIWKTYLTKIQPKDSSTLPVTTPASLKLFHFFRRKEEWQHALTVAQQLHNTEPVDNETLGTVYFQLGIAATTPHNEAVVYLEHALVHSSFPQKAHAYTALLQTLMGNQEFTKAMDIHQQYLEELPSSSDRSMARLELAECFIANHESKQGLRLLQEGLNESPTSLPLLHAKAEVLLHIGKCNDAIYLYEDMLLLTQESMEQTKILYSLFKLYLRLKLPLQALQYCKQELKLTKKLLGKYHLEVARIYLDRAKLHDGLCDYEEAIRYFNKAIHLETHALNRLQQESLESVDTNAFESYDTQIAELKAGMAETKKLLGKIHYKTGNWTGAVGVTGMSL